MTPGDRDFLEQFEDCTLPETQFGHAAHVRMAWLQLSVAPFDVALARMAAGIRRYASAMESASKYHETVTVAFARIIASRMREGESFTEFARPNPDLLSPQPLLARYYSAAVLDSRRDGNAPRPCPSPLKRLPQSRCAASLHCGSDFSRDGAAARPRYRR